MVYLRVVVYKAKSEAKMRIAKMSSAAKRVIQPRPKSPRIEDPAAFFLVDEADATAHVTSCIAYGSDLARAGPASSLLLDIMALICTDRSPSPSPPIVVLVYSLVSLAIPTLFFWFHLSKRGRVNFERLICVAGELGDVARLRFFAKLVAGKVPRSIVKGTAEGRACEAGASDG